MEERERESPGGCHVGLHSHVCLSYRGHFQLLSCEGKLVSMMVPNDPKRTPSPPRSLLDLAPRREGRWVFNGYFFQLHKSQLQGIWANQPIHLFLVGCMIPCLQETSVQAGLQQPLQDLHNAYNFLTG